MCDKGHVLLGQRKWYAEIYSKHSCDRAKDIHQDRYTFNSEQINNLLFAAEYTDECGG